MTYKACACARLTAENAGPISSGVRALTKLSSIDSEGAAALRSSITFGCHGVSGFQRTATRVSRGIVSLSSCSRLALSSVGIIESPVTFPPGCARFATRPDPTGSATSAMTMGMVDVARLAARVATVLSTTITSTLRWTRSAANPGTRS